MEANIRKKVAIVTLHGYHNYGNKLQNYALTKFITRMGCTVKTIDIVLSESSKSETSIHKLISSLVAFNHSIKKV